MVHVGLEPSGRLDAPQGGVLTGGGLATLPAQRAELLHYRTLLAWPALRKESGLALTLFVGDPMTVTFIKRQKERARQQRNQEKVDKRAERKREKAERPSRAESGVDPDIAHIVPGPQPLLEM